MPVAEAPNDRRQQSYFRFKDPDFLDQFISAAFAQKVSPRDLIDFCHRLHAHLAPDAAQRALDHEAAAHARQQSVKPHTVNCPPEDAKGSRK